MDLLCKKEGVKGLTIAISKVSTSILNIFTGKYEKITGITVQNGNYTFYDFNIPPNHDFIAWEYVVYDLTIKP